MPPVATFILFLTMSTLIVSLWHYYLWRRLVRATALQGRSRWFASLAIIVLGLGVPLSMMLGRSPIGATIRPALMFGYAWIATAFLILVVLLVADLARLVRWGIRKTARAEPLDPDRRTAVARIAGAAAAFVGIGGSIYGATRALGTIPIERIRVTLPRLPRSLSGTTVVQLTDMHIGPVLRREFVERVVAQVNGLTPDIIAITGDLVDGSPEELWAEVEPLSRLRAKYGVFFVTGNHEYYAGVSAWMKALPRLGLRVLRNERVSIGDGDDTFDLAGVDDWSADRHGQGHGSDVAAAVEGRDPRRELVLLAHQPRSIWEAAKHGVSLQLSGHTHGGQVFPWTFLVLLQQPFVVGLHKVRDTLLYVSRGTGFWGPPVRVGAPPEITLLQLETADSTSSSGERVAPTWPV